MMKTMIFNKALFAFTAFFAVVSCVKVLDPQDGPDERVTQTYSLSATCEQTKTWTNGSHVAWSEGDRLLVAYNSGGVRQLSVFETLEHDDLFEGEVVTPDDPSDWYAVYPAPSDASSSTVSICVPAQSIQYGNSKKTHLAGNGYPLWGKAEKVARADRPSIRMNQIAAVCNFNITNKEPYPIKVKKILFTAPVEIAGEFTGSITENSWTAVDGKSTKSIELDLKEAVEIASDGSASFYAGMMPFNTTGSFRITVIADNGGQEVYSTKTVDKTMHFDAGLIGRINYSFTDSRGENNDYYELVTSDHPEAGGWCGTYLVLNTDKTVAFAAKHGATEVEGVSITVGEDDRIQSSAEIDGYAITASGGTNGHLHFTNPTYYAYDIQNSEGKYIYYSSSKIRVNDSNVSGDYKYQGVFAFKDNGQVEFMIGKNDGTSNVYSLHYEKDTNLFKFSGDGAKRVLLYKKISTETEDQNLTFSSSSVEWALGEDEDHRIGETYNLPQEVSGLKTFVTYTSSNPDVAEIVGNSQVRIHGVGTTTITATAAKDGTYNSATASYTLTTKVYYRLLAADPGAQNWNGTYLIVNIDNDKAFSAVEGTAGTYAVNPSDGRIEASAELDEHAFTFSGGTEKHVKASEGNASNAYDILNSENKFVYYTNGQVQINESNIDAGAPYQGVFIYDGNGSVSMRIGKNESSEVSSLRYVYYNNGAFAFSKSNTSGRVLLYRKAANRFPQSIHFSSSNVSWTLGEGYQTGGIYTIPQTVTGARTFVKYSSSNTDVAEFVGNGQIKINGTGKATITATAVETADYHSATAEFMLTIAEPSAAEEVDLGTFELVNDMVRGYLEEAAEKYAADGSDWKDYSIAGTDKYPSGHWNGTVYDHPNPVIIPVDKPSGTKVSVEIYNDSQRTNLELRRDYSVKEGSVVEVVNLIPGRDYWYKVSYNGNELSRGKFRTTGLRRQIVVSYRQESGYANNLRDLGGMKTTDGKTLNYNLLFRGTNMDFLSEDEQEIITGYMKVRRDVDLRSYGADGNTDVAYAHRPLDPSLVEYTYGHLGAYKAEMWTNRIPPILNDIASSLSKGEACYIHCQGGADRTGILCILIEGLCGVSLKDCTMDYELTTFSCSETRRRCGTPEERDIYLYVHDGIQEILNQQGSTFKDKVVNKLLSCGVSQDTITKIQTAMVGN